LEAERTAHEKKKIKVMTEKGFFMLSLSKPQDPFGLGADFTSQIDPKMQALDQDTCTMLCKSITQPPRTTQQNCNDKVSNILIECPQAALFGRGSVWRGVSEPTEDEQRPGPRVPKTDAKKDKKR
jgi:hypothetical protein